MSLNDRLRKLTRVLRDLPDLRPCPNCGGRRSLRGLEAGASRCVHTLADGTEHVTSFGLPDAKFCVECGRLLDEQGRGTGSPLGEGPVFHIRARGAKREPAKATGGA